MSSAPESLILRKTAAANAPFARIAFCGKLGSMSRKEAVARIRAHEGQVVDLADPTADLVVLGADVLPVDIEEVLPAEAVESARAGRLEIISETQLWERLGLADDSVPQRQLYTPAMLSELLKVPIATIRRWHRRGLITPTREVFKLPYFDFQQVVTARRLAEMLEAGATAKEIETRLAQLSELLTGVEETVESAFGDR